MSTAKDPAKVRAGRIGASRRWSDPANRRIVRLAELSHEEAAAVRAILALKAARSTQADKAAAPGHE